MSATAPVSPLEKRTIAKVKRYLFAYIFPGEIFFQSVGVYMVIGVLTPNFNSAWQKYFYAATTTASK